MRELRPHQVKAIHSLKLSILDGKRRPLIQAPTGFGKTLTAAAIVDGALRKGNRVVFCVPALALIDQTVQAFYDEGIRDVGVIQADHYLTDYSKPVQVASVQTLDRRGFPETDIVIVDEAHRAYKAIFRWMKAEPEKLFVGLSATPWTPGLGKYYDDLIIASTTKELIDQGYLSKFEVYAPSHPDLSGVKTVAGDYHEGQLAEVMSDGGLVADVVSTWLKHGDNRPTLCFGVNRAHAERLEAQFKLAGVPTAYVDAFTSDHERTKIIKGFKNGAIKVICNVGVLTTGFDADVRCLILARPTKSEMLYVQIIGRALRTAPGKDRAIILDHSDTTLRLGFVTDIVHDELDKGADRKNANRPKEKKLPLPKECTSCHYLKPASVHVCPGCGFAPIADPGIECVDGDLVQVSGEKIAYDMQTKQRWYSGLIYYAQERGYKPGWAYFQFKEKFGIYPASTLKKVAQYPSDEVHRWITAQNIRKAKARKKMEGMHHAPAAV